MQDKVCLVTGANSGIGLETARGLAALGARVILACRDPEKGKAARQDIAASTGNERVDLVQIDLASFSSIRDCADGIRNSYDRLDVLVNNAGLMSRTRRTSADGLELQFMVHHLAVYQFTSLLLDLLKSSAPSRIVNVASMMHKMGKLDFDDLQCENRYGYYSSYAQSKLAEVHLTYHFAELLQGSGVTVNCLHPGAVATNLEGMSGWMSLFFSSPEKGARTSIYLASSPEVQGVTGKYFSNSKEAKSSRRSHDRGDRARLMEITERLVPA